MLDTPNPIDVHVGQTVRRIRKAKGVSQEALGDALGLTFQQVQKYENGANRVSASKLFQISRFLDVNVADFFDGLQTDVAPAPTSRQGGRPAQAAPLEERIARLEPKRRRLVEELLGHLLDVDEGAEETGADLQAQLARGGGG